MTPKEKVLDVFSGAFVHKGKDGVSIRLHGVTPYFCSQCGHTYSLPTPPADCSVIGRGKTEEEAWANASEVFVLASMT